ncbi:MAG TPA: ATP-grasp domain-containing protein [Verrucomicrobiae bacterium]|nr:ATP-grasp domain-containing protein [Verrucomicrobiae bacterium]
MTSTISDPTTTLHAAPRSDLPTDGIGALVIGGDYQGLGIVRSLGRQGVPVCILDNELSIARFSRHTKHTVRVAELRDETQTVETILSTGRELKLDGWILYPTRDETVAALSRHRDLLSRSFRVPTMHWDVVRWAWDKRNTYQMALDLGIPIPKTWFLSSLDDVDRLDLRFPLIIKPAIKEHFIYATKAKGWRANSRDELIRLLQQAAGFVPVPELMLQEYIPGGSGQQYGYGAFFKDGRAVGLMVTHNLRSHPLQLGRSSTFVQSIDLPVIEERAQTFLRAINYYGLVEVEFRLDPRDGDYKLLDVNARTWGYHSLGAAAGVDFSYMLFRDLTGQPVSPCRARPGVVWARLTTDIPSGLLAVVAGQLGLWKFVKSIASLDTEPVFSLNDPMPALAEAALIPYLFYKRGF